MLIFYLLHDHKILTPTTNLFYFLHFQFHTQKFYIFFFFLFFLSIYLLCLFLFFFLPNLFYVDTEIIPPPPPIKGMPLYSTEQRPGELFKFKEYTFILYSVPQHQCACFIEKYIRKF